MCLLKMHLSPEKIHQHHKNHDTFKSDAIRTYETKKQGIHDGRI